MAWDRLDDDAYSGDLPMDAFGQALTRAADASPHLPYAGELAEALLAAIHDAPEGAVGQREEAEALLARWIALPRVPTKGPRPRAQAGDVLLIPYAGDGAKQIYGRVLFAPTKARPGPGYGLCVLVHDLDAPAELDGVRAAPILLGPLHVGDDEILEGRWRIVGHVAPDDAELPTFAASVGDGRGGWRPRVEDYFGVELADTPETRARVARQSVGPARTVVIGIRMMRGLVRWMPSYADTLGVTRPR